MSLPFWDYFLSIEADLEKCSRFVHFSENNYETYSIEFARIIMASSSEFDTVIKLICNSIDVSQKPDNMPAYYPILHSKYPKFTTFEVNVPRHKLTCTHGKIGRLINAQIGGLRDTTKSNMKEINILNKPIFLMLFHPFLGYFAEFYIITKKFLVAHPKFNFIKLQNFLRLIVIRYTLMVTSGGIYPRQING